MRERRWYSRFGIEPPFPWTHPIFWPVYAFLVAAIIVGIAELVVRCFAA